MSNVAQLIERAAAANPSAPWGTFQAQDRFDRVLERAGEVGAALRSAGLGRGDLVALIGANRAAYLVTWLAAQMSGLRTALINPAYPDEFLGDMLDDLLPDALVWIARSPGELASRELMQIDATRAWEGDVDVLKRGTRRDLASGSGLDCAEAEIAAFVHTSGTSGRPKFCALSHDYFERLGRYFADVICLSRHDVVFNPLPMFHINPIGNGVVGALTGASAFLSTDRFSTDAFWPEVKAHGATVLILHGPPAGMLKARTTRADAQGHKVRVGFFCDPAFLEQFDVPIGIGGYGSTEAGGYCHSWKFRPGDGDLPPEGATHLSGQPRYDLDYDLAEDGEILVRGKAAQVLFSGYMRGGTLDFHLDPQGWFHTGDRGRRDAYGRLVFIERISESIRVNAEYVPIDLVEERLRRSGALQEFALWRVDSLTRGHEAVIYTTADSVDLDGVRAAVADLPKYMHPTEVISIAAIPRDEGVGKIQRRLLGAQPVLRREPV